MLCSRISGLMVGILLILFGQILYLQAQSLAPNTPLAQEVLPLLYPDGVYDAACQCLLWPPSGQTLTTWPDTFGPFEQEGETLAVHLKAAYPFEQGEVHKYFLITEVLPAHTEYTCHACAPIVGGAIMVQSGRSWSLEAVSQGIVMIGKFGKGPMSQLLVIGPEQYGVMLDVWGGNQGCFDQTLLLLAPISGKVDVIGRFEGGRARSECVVPDADIEVEYTVLAQPDVPYFPITLIKRILGEDRLLEEQVAIYQFSSGTYTLASSQINRQIEAYRMEPSAISATPATPMPTSTPFTTATGQQGLLTLPAWILIDSSSAAYTVFMALPQNLPEEELAAIKARMTKQSVIQLLPWDEFQTSVLPAIPGQIIKNDYPDTDLVAGIIEIFNRYPRTPIGVTWNGGIAMTAIDYHYADKMYQTYQTNPDDYERARKKDPKADPVNPQNHFNALIGPKKE